MGKKIMGQPPVIPSSVASESSVSSEETAPASPKNKARPKLSPRPNQASRKKIHQRLASKAPVDVNQGQRAQALLTLQKEYQAERTQLADLLGQKQLLEVLPAIEHYLAHPETAADDLPFEMSYIDGDQEISIVPPDAAARALLPALREQLQLKLKQLGEFYNRTQTWVMEQQLFTVQQRVDDYENRLASLKPDFIPAIVVPDHVEFEVPPLRKPSRKKQSHRPRVRLQATPDRSRRRRR